MQQQPILCQAGLPL